MPPKRSVAGRVLESRWWPLAGAAAQVALHAHTHLWSHARRVGGIAAELALLSICLQAFMLVMGTVAFHALQSARARRMRMFESTFAFALPHMRNAAAAIAALVVLGAVTTARFRQPPLSGFAPLASSLAHQGAITCGVVTGVVVALAQHIAADVAG